MTPPLPTKWIGAAHARRISLSVIDQGVSSAGNLAVTIVAARSLSVDSFGAFSVAYTVSILGIGAVRSVTTEPLLIRFSHSEVDPARRACARSVGSALVVGVAIAALVAAAALLFDGDIRRALVLVAVGLPGLVVQDSWRFSCFCLGRAGTALANDLAWCAVLLCLTVAVWTTTSLTLSWVLVIWLACPAVTALLGAVQLGMLPDPRRPVRWVGEHFDLGGRFLADYATAGGVGYVTLLVLGAISGLAATAAVRGVQTFFGPINVLFTGAMVALVPEGVRLAHADRPRVTALVRWLAVGLTGVAAAWWAIGLVLPDGWGEALLGGTWDDARDVLPAIGLGLVLGGVSGAAIIGLRSFADALRNLRGRLLTAPLLLGLPLLGAAFDGVEGYALGFAVASALAAVLWWHQFHLSVRATP